MEKIDNVFLQYCSDVLASTNSPLSGAMIVKIMNAYAIDYGVRVPENLTIQQSPNKRTLLFGYLRCFSSQQQYEILNSLLENQIFDSYEEKDKLEDLKNKVHSRFANVSDSYIQKREEWKKASAERVLSLVRSKKDKEIFSTNVNSNPNHNHKVFISHCSKDAGIVGAFKTYILLLD